MNKVPRWVFRYVGNKTFDFSSKKKDFLPKNDQIWPKIGIFGQFGPGHAGFFGALLVGRLVVVARGLYLARHLFTLFILKRTTNSSHRAIYICRHEAHNTQEGTQFRQMGRYLLETLPMSGWFPTGIYQSVPTGSADGRQMIA